MDLDELKNTWMVLDEQLKKNEMLNKRIVQEMLCEKSKKSLSWLINMEFLSIIILPLTIPVWIWVYNHSRISDALSTKILSIFSIVFCIIAVIWLCYKVWKYLLKIDFSKHIKDNMQYVNNYSIMIKKEKIISYFIILPVYSFLGAFCYYELKANLSLWIFLVVVLTIGIIITYWGYEKIYNNKIQSIQKSLEELNELKEE